MKKLGIIAILLTTFSLSGIAQCATWNDLSNKEEIEEAHVLYRDFFKREDYAQAFSYWQKAFEAAPAADGKRDLHFSNGIELYLDMFTKETDADKKEEFKAKVLELYEQWVGCVEAGTITLSNTDMEKHVGYIRGREAFNMFYTLNVPYEDNIKMMDAAIEVSGNDTEYIILDPYARIVQFQFTNELMDKTVARSIYQKLNDIADYNIENNKQYGAAYKQSKESMNAVFATIENYIFDCDYFKDKLLPKYKSDPNNGELVKEVYNTLLQRGCEKEDPIMMELQGKYQVYADSINAILQQEFYLENPGSWASDLYKKGEYNTAIEKWGEAINKSDEAEKKAEYSYWIAYTNFYKLNKTSGVLSGARKGTEASAVAGNAYILIGDYYAKIGRSCGDAWEQRLAILGAMAKYATAKSVDPSVADAANRKLNLYAASKPERQEGFMRKVSEGQRVKAKCIGETVTVSFVD